MKTEGGGYDFTYQQDGTKISLRIYNGYTWFEGQIVQDVIEGKLMQQSGTTGDGKYTKSP